MIDKALNSGRLTTGEARSLQGKILHQAEGYDGRIGRGQAFAFTDHIKKESSFISSQLQNNLVVPQVAVRGGAGEAGRLAS